MYSRGTAAVNGDAPVAEVVEAVRLLAASKNGRSSPFERSRQPLSSSSFELRLQSEAVEAAKTSKVHIYVYSTASSSRSPTSRKARTMLLQIDSLYSSHSSLTLTEAACSSIYKENSQ